jgi:hypothetical protein
MSRISWQISSGTFGLLLRHRDLHRQNDNSLRRHALSGGRSSIVFEIEIVADLAEADEKFWSMRTLMDTGLASRRSMRLA